MILRTLTERAARSYVAGEELSDALGVARTLERDQLRSTIAYWNDRGEDPGKVCAAYLAAIEGAADLAQPTSVSIKTPALAMSDTSVDLLAERCRARGVGLHFDSLGVEHQGPTFRIIERQAPIVAGLGCTLPGRFARSVDDAEQAIARGLRVRVVKGQWPDPANDLDPRRGFMAVIDRLAGRAAHVAVATHDPSLAAEALGMLAARGTPVELELLFGLPVHGAREVARRLTVPVRLYVPYGRAWLPYSLSAARENPRMLRWLLHDAVRGRTLRTGRRL